MSYIKVLQYPAVRVRVELMAAKMKVATLSARLEDSSHAIMRHQVCLRFS